jgi:hypothetical protein
VLRLAALLGLIWLAGCALPSQVALRLTFEGGGFGTVRSTPAGLECQAGAEACSAAFPVGTRVTLQAEAGENSAFRGWGGACEGLETCTVTLETAADVGARFERTQFVLDLTMTGAGSGAVRIVPYDVLCETSCQQIYPVSVEPIRVSLDPTPTDGSVFRAWGGDCSGNGQCFLDMRQDRSVTAEFTYPPPDIVRFAAEPSSILAGQSAVLSWDIESRGDVEVSISPEPESALSDTSAVVRPSGNTTYTLTATSAYGQSSETVTVTVRESATLNVTVSGEGSVISAQPVNVIDCDARGGSCRALFEVGTTVRLQALGGAAVTWGGCTVSGAFCDVTMDRSRTVSAAFE